MGPDAQAKGAWHGRKGRGKVAKRSLTPHHIIKCTRIRGGCPCLARAVEGSDSQLADVNASIACARLLIMASSRALLPIGIGTSGSACNPAARNPVACNRAACKHAVTQSRSHAVTQSRSHVITQSRNRAVTQSRSMQSRNTQSRSTQPPVRFLGRKRHACSLQALQSDTTMVVPCSTCYSSVSSMK